MEPNKKICGAHIYFDNNGTTLICPPAEKIHAAWNKCYNASSDSKVAKAAKAILDKAINEVLAHCNVSIATHHAIFTSCGSESNSFILQSCVSAYHAKMQEKSLNTLPHIIVSATEHSSIIKCAEYLKETKKAEVTYISPTIYGNILPADIEKEIKFNTCLISVMFANNEIPVINNVKLIGEMAHKRKIPFHTDCVQTFGKYKIDLKTMPIAALSASFHKFYGPKGVGLLILSNHLIEGYNLKPIVWGTQQDGLRGGTENIAGIAAGLTALKCAFKDRKKKNTHLYKLRYYCLSQLKSIFLFNRYDDYVFNEEKERKDLEIVSLGPPEDQKAFILPNTLLISVCKNRGKPLCNIDLKHFLDSKGCVVGIGSTCLTSSDKASHVLTAIGAPPVVKRGVIRVSFNDSNTLKEIDKFIKVLVQGVLVQCKDIKLDEKGLKKMRDSKNSIKNK
jgi:cysteine desulfurase